MAARALLALLLISVGAPAYASDDVPAAPLPEESPRRTAVGLDFGIASAVGFGGVTLTRAFTNSTQLELGGGLGLTGLQLSLMEKLILGPGRDHFVSGVGVSISFPGDSTFVTGHPIWLNVDLAGYQHRFDDGLAFSVAVGFTGGLGGGRLCLPPDGCEPQFLHDVNTFWGPQGRAGVAYWF